MYITERNMHHLCIHDNLFNCRPPHQHIHLKEKKQVLQCTNSKMLFCEKKLPLIENLRIKAPNKHSWLCYCPVEVSPIEISPLNEWSIDSTAVMQNLSIQLEVYFHWNQGYSGPKCKGMHVIFQKNDKKGKKRAKCLKIRQKFTKFKNILKKGSLMCATVACIKQLEYALVLHLRYII